MYNFKVKFESNPIHWCCISNISQCLKMHSETDWHKEHHQQTNTHIDVAKTWSQKMKPQNEHRIHSATQFELNLIHCHCNTLSNNTKKWILIQTDINSTINWLTKACKDTRPLKVIDFVCGGVWFFPLSS